MGFFIYYRKVLHNFVDTSFILIFTTLLTTNHLYKMKNLTLQDPKTFGLPNKEKVKNVIKLFQSENKEQFINSYGELNNTDKFYALATCVYYFTDVKMARQMFLEELREDLMTLKLLNKPFPADGKDFGFGYEYKGYAYDKEIMDRISLSYFEVK